MARLSSYQSLLVIATVSIFVSNLPDYLHHQNLAESLSAPKNWVLGIALLSMPIVMRAEAHDQALRSPLTLWCLLYIWVSVLWVFLSNQTDDTWKELRLRVLAVVEMLISLMVFAHPRAVILAQKCLIGTLLFGTAVNLYETFAPGSFSLVFGRSAGLYMNPNLSGQALALGMILSVSVLPAAWRIPYVLLTGVGIFSTFSRASILAWALSSATMLYVKPVRWRDALPTVAVCLGVTIFVVMPRLDNWLSSWERSGTINADVQERLEWLTNPFGVVDHSSWSRTTLAKEGWDRFVEEPVVGGGTGSTHRTNPEPHNQFLALMIDHGLVGAVLLPALVLAMGWRARGETKHTAIVFGVMILMLSFSTHTILRDEHSLVLFALMAAMVGVSRETGDSRVLSRSVKVHEAETALGSSQVTA